MRSILALALLVTACSSSDPKLDAPKLDPKQNLVCIRVALADPKATCDVELTDVGELHTHRARVTQEKRTVVCSLNDRSVEAVCGGLFPAEKKTEEAKAQ